MGSWFPPGSWVKRFKLINLSKMAHELSLYWWLGLWSHNDFCRKLKWKVRLFTLIALWGHFSTGSMLQSGSMVRRAQRGEKGTERRGWRWPSIWCCCKLWTDFFLIALSFLKGLWITQRVGNDDSHVKPQKIRFSMNKITSGIHIGKNNTFAHKCAALTAGVNSKAEAPDDSQHKTPHSTCM